MAAAHDVQLKDFQPLYERWGQYVLPDGIITLARVFVSAVGQEESYRQVRHAIHMEVIAPATLKGPPGNDIFREQDVKTVVTEFQTVRKAESKYELEDRSILSLRWTPMKFKLTSKFNNAGEPIIGAEAGLEMEIVGTERDGEDSAPGKRV